MKERPILFSAPMVKAILEGRKSQTRRVVKTLYEAHIDSTGVYTLVNGGPDCEYLDFKREVKCPYGQPGERLWVREAWRVPSGAPRGWVDYKADDDRAGFVWMPSIHMPRWASRLTLEIVNVRVERVQEISEKDAIAEGLYIWRNPEGVEHYGRDLPDVWERDPRITYKRLWNSINGKRPGCAWADNPWVWVVEFRKVTP